LQIEAADGRQLNQHVLSAVYRSSWKCLLVLVGSESLVKTGMGWLRPFASASAL